MAGNAPESRETLLGLTNGYRVSQAIHVAAVLGLADLLRKGPRTLAELAEATTTSAPALGRLLTALASVGIFAEGDGSYRQTRLSSWLESDAPGSLRGWALQIGQPYYWTTWGHLERSVRTGEPAFKDLYGTNAWDYRAAHPDANVIFNAAMTGLSAGDADAIAAAYDFSGITQLVDIGGGEGALLATILRANPKLRGIVFDQPHVTEKAAALLREAGVADRCQVMSGSFFENVPAADAYILKSIVHDWDDASAAAILRRCREAVADAGKVLIVERVLRPSNEPDQAKFGDLNMLVMLGGRERSAAEFERLCVHSGFHMTGIIATASPFSIIEARPA